MNQTNGLGRDLLEVYKLVRDQQEMLITLLFQQTAVMTVLNASLPDFRPAYETEFAATQADETSQRLLATLPLLDSTIRALERRYGGPKPSRPN